MTTATANIRPILFVGPERVIIDTLGFIVRQHGFASATAYSGSEGVNAARQQRPWFALIELIMPDMTGIDTAIQILREQPDCEVLLYSGQRDTTRLRDNGRQQGFDFEIVAWPIKPQDLLERVNTVAAGKGFMPTHNQVVLLVDDEPVIVHTLAIILKKHGVEAATAYSGMGAIEAARRLRPKLIVMGGFMPPGMHGIEASKVILAEQPDCKIAIFSGAAATAELLNRARSEGYEFEILAKPCTLQQLWALLDRVGIETNRPSSSGRQQWRVRRS